MTIGIYSFFLLMGILGGVHFYKKREGWWLVLCVWNTVIYFSLLYNIILERYE